MKFTIRHTWNVTEEDYWPKIFFNDDYNLRLYKEGLQFPGYEVLEAKEHPDGSRTRKLRIEPKADAPTVVKKLIGDSLQYTEEGRWDPKTRRWSYAVTLSKLADKITIKGEFWVEKRGDKQIERICDVDVNVRIFGVGGVVESFIEKTTRESYEKTGKFTTAYIREHNLGTT